MSVRVLAVPTLCSLLVLAGCGGGGGEAAALAEVDELVQMPGQGLTKAERDEVHRLPSGARLIPVAWLHALEQPGSTAPFLEPAFTRRFGFIPGKEGEAPLGFGQAEGYDDMTGEPLGSFYGLSCAACHTSEIRYEKKLLRIEGGAGMVDVTGYGGALVAALEETAADQEKCERFLTRVAGGRPQSCALGSIELTAALSRYHAAQQRNLVSVHEGFGRADTSARGINEMMDGWLRQNRNRTPITAPVGIPSLWGSNQFDYMHYEGGIRQPLARNITQVVSSGGQVFAPSCPGCGSRTTILLRNLERIEGIYAKVKAPKWPEKVLGSIVRSRAKRGKKLYEASCAGCHDGKRKGDELVLEVMTTEEIGTDPALAERSREIEIFLPGESEALPGTDAFRRATNTIIDQLLSQQKLSPAAKETLTGGRENEWRLTGGYKAPPLDGIWATPPYLHNGAVASLHELLLPVAKRADRFFVGGPERPYDPVNVGYDVADVGGGFEVRVGPGNDNGGHEGRQFGTKLSEDERLDLLEFLKTF